MKKKAGVDFGLTHVKACWRKPDGETMYLSTADVSRTSLVSVLQHEGVTDLSVGGNGSRTGFEDFQHHMMPGNPLETEIRMQARGAKHLLTVEVRPPETKHVVISIGTGTSFAVVNGAGIDFPVGSAFGAGSIEGLLVLQGIRSAADIDRLLIGAGNTSLDLRIKDAIPALKESRYADWIACSFGLATRQSFADERELRVRFARSCVNALAADIACRLMLFDQIPDYRGARDVIFLGTLPQRSRVVRETLQATTLKLRKTPIFPTHGAYALAAGAYHTVDP